jgi:hypothetical protein
MFKNTYVKSFLSAIVIAVLGYVLLILTFIFDALFQSLIDGVFKLFTSTDINMVWPWFPPVKHAMFIVVIALISWFVFKSKLADIYKATCSIVPSAVIFASIGMFLNRWPVLVYGLSALVFLAIIAYLYKTKRSWFYYYAVFLITFSMLIFTLLGGEI